MWSREEIDEFFPESWREFKKVSRCEARLR
jgi:hypothetical protein